MLNSTVAAILAMENGCFEDNRRYTHVSFQGLIVAAGARERSLVFPGNDLPGVFGAGAFQTLVNRDLVKPSQRVLIVGCGNVGLIAAYHALQAGINVAALVDIAPEISGYKVHADKIKRMGVPIYLEHTVVCAEGDGKVGATIAPVNESGSPILSEAQTFAVDTVLIAVGLTSVDEFFLDAQGYDFTVLKTGDADEIAEASSAMLGGRIAGRRMAQLLGKEVDVPSEWSEKQAILKSRPGRVFDRERPELTENFQPVFHCMQEIPCNPCTTVCRFDSIKLVGETDSILDLPQFEGKCIGCGLCAAICPGLAISLARLSDKPGYADVVVPHEFSHPYEVGSDNGMRYQRSRASVRARFVTPNFSGSIRRTSSRYKFRLSGNNSTGIRRTYLRPNLFLNPSLSIFLKMELSVGVSGSQSGDHWCPGKQGQDLNQLKAIRVGMGACGGKTCSVLLSRIMAQAGQRQSFRTSRPPVSVEIPLWAVGNLE